MLYSRRKKTKLIPSLIRSIGMKVWLRLLWFVFVIAIIIQSCSAGVIVNVINVDLRVTALTPVAVELPYDIGYLVFKQNESLAGGESVGSAFMETGSKYDDNGVATSTVTIQITDQGYIYPSALWLGAAVPIGFTQEASDIGLLWGDERPIPVGIDGDGDPYNEEPYVIIPWQFVALHDQSTIWGTGWVTLSNIDTRISPMTENGVDYLASPAYIVRQVVLASNEIDLLAGVIPIEWYNGGGVSNGGGNGGFTSVPEPSAYIILLVLIFCILLKKRSLNELVSYLRYS